MTTLDLFADEPAPTLASPVAPATKEPDPERAAYVLTPIHLNRWSYRGEVIFYDDSKHRVPGRGRWASVEGIGAPEIRGDSHVDICKALDARLEGAMS